MKSQAAMRPHGVVADSDRLPARHGLICHCVPEILRRGRVREEPGGSPVPYQMDLGRHHLGPGHHLGLKFSQLLV